MNATTKFPDPDSLSRTIDVLKSSRKMTVVFHRNPDGDAIGAALAIYHFFKDKGHEVAMVSPDRFPDFLKWMIGSDRIMVASEPGNLEKAEALIREAEVLFMVDMPAAHRAGKDLTKAIDEAGGYRILIDHHLNPNWDCHFCYSTPATSSACELVYFFLYRYLAPKEKLTLPIAEALYVGIITDTGSVSYACDNESTYIVLHDLMKTGLKGEAIHRKVYDNFTESRMRLLGFALSERLTVMPQYAASYIYLTKEDLDAHDFRVGDTEGFVNYGLSIEGVRFTALFTERDGRIRVSFRSMGNFPCNRFAQTYYNGGGHPNASGATYYGKIEKACRIFEDALAECNPLIYKKQ